MGDHLAQFTSCPNAAVCEDNDQPTTEVVWKALPRLLTTSRLPLPSGSLYIGHLGCATSVVSSPSIFDLLLDEKQCTLGVDTKD